MHLCAVYVEGVIVVCCLSLALSGVILGRCDVLPPWSLYIHGCLGGIALDSAL